MEVKLQSSWVTPPHPDQFKPVALNGELPPAQGRTFLPVGALQSFGDCCHSASGWLLSSENNNQILRFNPDNGILRCGSGTTLKQVVDAALPSGWTVPVMPGTRRVTVGGAVANDIHGKNHHSQGSFGCHVIQLELLRSDGSRTLCSRDKNSDLFYATLGGFGLTGYISWVELKLQPDNSPFLDCETIPFHGVSECLELFEASCNDYEHCFAWVDNSRRGANFPRGLFTRANPAKAKNIQGKKPRYPEEWSLPFKPPTNLVRHLPVKIFNSLRFGSGKLAGQQSKLIETDRVLFPLDRLNHWEHLYGPSGNLHYQCVLVTQPEAALKALFREVAKAKLSTPLTVLKKFGEDHSGGMLSFPRAGYSVAMDFPNRGKQTAQLFANLDRVVTDAHGAVNPAKDSHMSREMFEYGFPRYEEFETLIDPHFSSSFWERVQPQR